MTTAEQETTILAIKSALDLRVGQVALLRQSKDFNLILQSANLGRWDQVKLLMIQDGILERATKS